MCEEGGVYTHNRILKVWEEGGGHWCVCVCEREKVGDVYTQGMYLLCIDGWG